ncbi:uncharacterized protein PAE49_020901 [Odontesthes bonariensis]|uniref:uncharacterized protein LOC142369488 n=1 Tax=Odontesthes bonariensis TaxID=219752 RepID=UPI003F583875
MAALTSLSVSLLCVGLLLSVSAEQKIIPAEPGQDVTLTCRAPNNNPIIVVEWSRADLKPKYVLIYRDGHYGQHDQNPSFKNRVDLQDRQMKDGDVSLILRNVTTEDKGTYECRVKQEGTNQERGFKTISIILLEVVEPGKRTGGGEGGGEKGGGGAVGLIVGLIVLSLLLLLAVGGFLIYKRKPAWLNRYQPPAKPAAVEQKIITAKPGQDVTLTCRAPNNNLIIVVEWSRTDRGKEYVLIYRDDQLDLDGQHPSFKKRVDLQDRQMKDGDVSLILKDVTTADRGTYECRVVQEGTNQERELKTISIILLAVVEAGTEEGGEKEGGEKEGGEEEGGEKEGGEEEGGEKEGGEKEGGEEDVLLD